MTAFEILALLLTLASAFAYVNHRWFHQPPSIALMAMALAVSMALLAADRIGWLGIRDVVSSVLDRMNLHGTFLHGVLGVLLFAGALHVSLEHLREERLAIGTLAFGGTVLSTFIVGGLVYVLLQSMGRPTSFAVCILFGALISPTDPISVLAILTRTGIPKNLEIQVAGEALFNDGVGVVLYLTILDVVAYGGDASPGGVFLLFFRQSLGGVAFGWATGYVTYRLVRSIDHYQTELLLTLALVLGGYAVAERVHVSAPIAAVVAGLLIGNQGRAKGMSDTTRDHLDKFWSLIDEILNALLFVLIGLELMRVTLSSATVAAAAAAIPIVLLSRWVSVAAPVAALSRVVPFAHGAVAVLTWGGLRGGISIALALSMPSGRARELIVCMTYFVVVFSMLVQGLTLAPLARRLRPRWEARSTASARLHEA